MTPEFIAGIVATGVFSIIGYLLAQKDKQQGKEIEAMRADHEKRVEEIKGSINLLFRKHDEDVARLEALKLQIAERHYGKDELDRRFDRVEASMRVGFDSLLSEIKSLSASLMAHIQRDDKK